MKETQAVEIGKCWRCGLPTTEPSRGLGNGLRICKPCQAMDIAELGDDL